MSRFGVIGGPGHHAPELAESLVHLGHAVSLTSQYPGYSVRDVTKGKDNRAPVAARLVHDSVRTLVAALQFRIGKRLPSSLDFLVYNHVYSHLAARAVAHCDALVAFTFVAEPALATAVALGKQATLEEPATHVDEYYRLVRQEHGSARMPMDPRSVRPPSAVIRQARREYALAPRIHVLSTFARQSFVNAGVAPGKVRVVAPGVDTDFFRATSPRDSGVLRLLYVGRLELAKGIRHLLLAMEQLRDLDVELVLAGTMTEPVRQLIGQTRARVSLSGFLDHEQLRGAYESCHALVFPSLSDGFGLVVLEAMASGRPVIATTACGAADAVQEGVEGWLVRPSDPDALAERIRELVAHPERGVEMGAAAATRARAEFSLAAYTARLAKAFIGS